MARFRFRVVRDEAVEHLVQNMNEEEISGFRFGERVEVGVRGQGKMVKTTGFATFHHPHHIVTIANIAANVICHCHVPPLQ